MTDYTTLGFKAGLEIHQQLEGDGKKLFCSCPSVLRNEPGEFLVERKLHAIAGESGEVDVAAAYQAAKDMTYVYEGYDSTCLVELDEEPPHLINEDVLKVGLHVALLLGCTIQPVVQIMRKTVVDGSNTGGFQRTLFFGRDGHITLSSGKKVGIESVCLEEDSARIVSRDEKKKRVTYRLDRLGIPLVEIATAPDLATPAEAREAALLIGEILRACSVRRGLGTIRQDVNMSLKRGKRVEIKGFQDIDSIETVLEKEIVRHQDLIKQKKSVEEVRQALPSGETKFLRPLPGAARMYPETDLPLLKIDRDLLNEAKKTLPKVMSKAEAEKALKKLGLHTEMIALVLKSRKVNELQVLHKVHPDANLIAKMLLLFPKELSSKLGKSTDELEEVLHEDALEQLLALVHKGELADSDVKEAMQRLVEGKEFGEAIRFERLDTSEAESIVMAIVKGKPGLRPNAYMGLVMKDPRLQGKLDGKTAMQLISKFAK